MAARVFFVGATGHIGAALLEILRAAYPELSIVAIVRSSSDAKAINEAYNGTVEPLLGSLDDFLLLKKQASEAQIVINCAPDMGLDLGLSAILSGLSLSGHDRRFYIHTSGASRTWVAPDPTHPGSRIWHDITDVRSLPPTATHAVTDIMVQSANTASVHTAIVSPSFVVGKSPSKTHKPPIIFPDWMHVTRAAGSGWTIGPGANHTTFVDTQDLANLYLLLVKDALSIIRDGEPAAVRPEVWGPEAYFFGDTLEISLREFTEKHLLPALKRNGAGHWVQDGEGGGIKELMLEDVVDCIMTRVGGTEGANLWSRHIAEGFGISMRVRGRRGREYLGWKTSDGVDLDEAVRATVDEIKRAGGGVNSVCE
ncbi:hypothetical protein QBC42DRAFT_262191 [Cladorrhinum samala]|uniref:NAD(P)-binding domain-containing protein n=1 Tax=Cladorrhinum samala TaxID=585594 RepID=A0AAV9HWB1_9PEZI|nr:hypothetical protein QBC42DRAFT_262191 [Cladorrhinum samala]